MDHFSADLRGKLLVPQEPYLSQLSRFTGSVLLIVCRYIAFVNITILKRNEFVCNDKYFKLKVLGSSLEFLQSYMICCCIKEKTSLHPWLDNLTNQFVEVSVTINWHCCTLHHKILLEKIFWNESLYLKEIHDKRLIILRYIFTTAQN